jgi:hypothetical protein
MLEIQIVEGPAKNGFQQVGSFAVKISVIDDAKLDVVDPLKVITPVAVIETPDMIARVLQELGSRDYRYNHLSKDWVGWMVMDVCGIDNTETGRAYAKNLVRRLCAEGKAEIFQKHDSKRQKRNYVRAAQPSDGLFS